MACSTEGITRVRIRPLTPGLAPAGAMEVTWDSTQAGRWHQAYVNGRLAGVTARPEDRRLCVSAPAGAGGACEALLVEVVAVDAADRGTDFSAGLAGFAASGGRRVRLTWQAGPHLGADLDAFDVFADGRSGTVDYARPLNECPIPAAPGGVGPWGWGTGGYGAGGYGIGAAVYEWTTDELAGGMWRLAVVASDAAGNRLSSVAEIEAAMTPLPRPPTEFRLASYAPLARTATLAWQPSPDL